MSPETAKKALILVNNSEMMNPLNLIIEERIEYYRKRLETESEFNDILKIQGSIKELRNLAYLKEEVIEKSKGK